MLSFINFIMVLGLLIWCRDFAVIFAIFANVCRVFCYFLSWFSTVPTNQGRGGLTLKFNLFVKGNKNVVWRFETTLLGATWASLSKCHSAQSNVFGGGVHKCNRRTDRETDRQTDAAMVTSVALARHAVFLILFKPPPRQGRAIKYVNSWLATLCFFSACLNCRLCIFFVFYRKKYRYNWNKNN